jgi:hypothetical protein
MSIRTIEALVKTIDEIKDSLIVRGRGRPEKL